ncbi:hypothetical protein A2U01_0023324, partial [Trifolium medium]|nr:hypothetical protein [Trifolium medium]
QEAEWNREIEIFLQQLDCGREEAPKVVEKLPGLKELPPKWKYVFLGENRKKPIVISSVLEPFEEEELLNEAKTVNDSLEGDLNGIIHICCLHTPKKDKEFNPVVQSREIPTPTLEDLVKEEIMKLFETGVIKCVLDSLRLNPVGGTSKTKGSKKPPKRSIKRKRFKWKTKKENPKSDPESVNSWLIDCKVAPLKKVNKRSRVESKLKYPP